MTIKTYGTVSPEQRSRMNGLEFVQGLASGALPLNTIAQTLGYDVVEAESGRVVITLVPTGAHLNPAGTVHGGLTATLLDSCMGLAIWRSITHDFTGRVASTEWTHTVHRESFQRVNREGWRVRRGRPSSPLRRRNGLCCRTD